jgi:large subunit ribosomal protein L30
MAETTTGRIRVIQTASPIGRHRRQRANLVGLGLNKIGRSRVLSDTPSVRGRISQVHHLVRVEPVGEDEAPGAAPKQAAATEDQAPGIVKAEE